MSSGHPDKRDELIKQLLDSPAYVRHTQNLWLSAIRVKQSHPQFHSGIYMTWLRKAIQENMPGDEFVREQLIQAGDSLARRPPSATGQSSFPELAVWQGETIPLETGGHEGRGLP